jgi:uncharacterized damage-inducible protein DinB
VRSRADLAIATLRFNRDVLMNNLSTVTLDEALQAAGGYRSIVGILKHTAGWSHVYRSYAFDAEPKHYAQTAWPRGMRDTIDPTHEYFDEIVAWFDASWDDWRTALAAVPDEGFDEPHRVHWGGTMPLWDILVLIAQHWSFHTGEINAVLSIIRGEAWEYTEEVEENHISTRGHRLRPNWMSDQQAAAHEAYLVKRDAELHGA